MPVYYSACILSGALDSLQARARGWWGGAGTANTVQVVGPHWLAGDNHGQGSGRGLDS